MHQLVISRANTDKELVYMYMYISLESIRLNSHKRAIRCSRTKEIITRTTSAAVVLFFNKNKHPGKYDNDAHQSVATKKHHKVKRELRSKPRRTI